MKNLGIGAAMVLALVFSANHATAADYVEPSPVFGLSGHIGFEAAYLTAFDNDSTDGRNQAASYRFEGQIVARPGGAHILGTTFSFRHEDWDESDPVFINQEMDNQIQGSVHYLYEISPMLRVGGFFAITNTDLLISGSDDDLTYLVGGEINFDLNDQLLLFAQAGFGDVIDHTQTDLEGFNDGVFVRGGGTWFITQNTALTVEGEWAETDKYLDVTSSAFSRDSGEFYGISFRGETRLPIEMPLTFTYFVQHNRIDSTDGTPDEYVEETRVGVGLRWLFGAETPREAHDRGRLIGPPRLPSRASAWIEVLD